MILQINSGKVPDLMKHSHWRSFTCFLVLRHDYNTTTHPAKHDTRVIMLNWRFVIYSSERRRGLRYILTFSSTRLQPELENIGVFGGNSNSSTMALISLSSSSMCFAVALSRMHSLTCSRSSGRKGTKALTRFLSITLLYFRPPVHLRTIK